MKSRLVYFLMFTMVSISCKKTVVVEKIVEVDKQYAWTELKDLSLSFNNRIQLNSILINDSTVGFINNDGLFGMNANTLKFNSNLGGFYGFGSSTVGEKPTATNEILVTAYRDYAKAVSVASPVLTGGSAPINPAYNNDSTFLEFQKPYISNISPQAIVKNRFILLPFFSKLSSQQKQFAYFVSVSPKISAGLKTNSIITLQFNAMSSIFASGLYYINSFNDRFFTSYGDDFYRVDTSGNIKSFGAPMYSISGMFTLSGYLFAVNPNGRIYISSDNGENWSLFTTLDSIWGLIRFQQIGDEAFAIYRDQIWQLTLEGSTLTIKELVNEGMERTVITSIIKCSDKVFVTTKYGVYYRMWDKFKEFKK